jgi:hypothetical protein
MVVAASLFIVIYGPFPITWETIQAMLQELFTFNLLFLFILMPLKGSLARKVAILLLGNILSFIWGILFYLFAQQLIGQFGGVFNALYVILGPLLNVLWVVAFWSTSLTFLAETQNKERWKA